MNISDNKIISLPILVVREAAIYFLFVFLVCIFTYPLILHPGSLLRGLNDPYLFTWILSWAAEHVYSNPAGLFNADIFYPYGNTFAYSEPLLIPALLTAAPILKYSGNPILAHNLTLLIFQAVGGWSACFATKKITHSIAAGWIAGIAFAVSPFRTGYYNYLNVHMQFAIPLALVCLALYFEKRTIGYLIATVFLFWTQMVTIFYGGVPLSLLLVLFFIAFLLLRPLGWRSRTFMQLLGAAVILLVLLAPVLWPYFTVFQDLGLERSLKDVHRYSADWYSFFDVGKEHNFYRLANSGKCPGFFPGFTIYLLSAVALLSLWKPEQNTPNPLWVRTQRGIGILTSLLVLVTSVLLVQQTGKLVLPLLPDIHITLAQSTLGILIAGILALMIRGWSRRNNSQPTLCHREWIMILGLFSLFFALLTLGPTMYIKGKAVGVGIYTYIYKIFLPIHTIRLSIRLGYMPVLLLSMLAGFGLVIVQRWLPPRLRPFIWILPLLLLFEYSSFPLKYQTVNWNKTPVIYQWLSKQKGNFAILEWPSNNEEVDSKYVFWSIRHKKMGVTGVSGFFPPFSKHVVKEMIRFPSAGSISFLRQIYPLKYLIIHNDHFFKPAHQQIAMGWIHNVPNGLKLVRQFAGTSVFEFIDTPETAISWERTFSTAMVKKNPMASFTLTRKNGGLNTMNTPVTVDVIFNDHVIQKISADSIPKKHRITLPGPYPAADRNILRLSSRQPGRSIIVSGFELDR